MTPPGDRLRLSDADDSALVSAAQAGDTAALDVLLARHYDAVHARCRRILRDPRDADDACQDALIAVATKLSAFDGRAKFTTWLYTVSTNAALGLLRKRRDREQTTDEVPEPEPGGDGPSRVDDRVAARIDVDTALARMTPEYRDPVVLRDLCDLDYPEIADALGLELGTVKSRISRGRRELVRILGTER